MVDTRNRPIAAKLIQDFATGQITNDEFDEQYPHSEDRAIQAIWNYLWGMWDEVTTRSLTNEHQLSENQQALFSRCSDFLKTDLEYTGPSIGGSLLDGLRAAWKSVAVKEKRTVIESPMNPEWWPFSSEEQYRQHVPTTAS